MMSAFGGLASPHGSCLLDPVQPWGLSLPRWPCTCSLPPGEVGDVTVLGTWGAGHRHCRGGGRGALAHMAPLAFLSFPPSLLPSVPAHSSVHSFSAGHQLWPGAGLGSGGVGGRLGERGTRAAASLALRELQLGTGVRLRSDASSPTSEPWALKAGRQPCEVGVTGEPAGARDEGSGCFSQGGEGGTGVGEEKGQEEGARRTEPAEGAVCAGGWGSLCRRVCWEPVSRLPGPAGRSISISQDSWAGLDDDWLPSPPGQGLGGPGGWSPVPERAVCPPAGAVSDGPGGRISGLVSDGDRGPRCRPRTASDEGRPLPWLGTSLRSGAGEEGSVGGASWRLQAPAVWGSANH